MQSGLLTNVFQSVAPPHSASAAVASSNLQAAYLQELLQALLSMLTEQQLSPLSDTFITLSRQSTAGIPLPVQPLSTT